MNSKTLNIILGIVVLVLIGWLIYNQGWLNKLTNNTVDNQILDNATNNQISLGNNTNSVTDNNSKPTSPTIPTGWQKLTNTTMGFTVYYPSDYRAQSIGMFSDQEEIASDIQIYDPASDNGAVTFQELSPPGRVDDFANMDLLTWANKFRQINDEHATSVLVSDVVGGKVAYSFKLKGGISLDSSGSGTALPPYEKTYKVLMTTNRAGDKIIIFHLSDDVTMKQIVSTLWFV